jgi:hypothetical protein
MSAGFMLQFDRHLGLFATCMYMTLLCWLHFGRELTYLEVRDLPHRAKKPVQPLKTGHGLSAAAIWDPQKALDRFEVACVTLHMSPCVYGSESCPGFPHASRGLQLNRPSSVGKRFHPSKTSAGPAPIHSSSRMREVKYSHIPNQIAEIPR